MSRVLFWAWVAACVVNFAAAVLHAIAGRWGEAGDRALLGILTAILASQTAEIRRLKRRRQP